MATKDLLDCRTTVTRLAHVKHLAEARFSQNKLNHQADILRFMRLGECFGKTQFLSESYDLRPAVCASLAEGAQCACTAVSPEGWRAETGAADR